MVTVEHDTVTLTKKIEASVSSLWDAYTNLSTRTRWSVPDGEAMNYEAADFREGGIDRYTCGPPESMDFHARVEYVRIEPLSLIVYSETVATPQQTLATGLVSWEFSESSNAALVTVTCQLASFVGHDMIEGNKNGHTKALDQLAAFVTE